MQMMAERLRRYGSTSRANLEVHHECMWMRLGGTPLPQLYHVKGQRNAACSRHLVKKVMTKIHPLGRFAIYAKQILRFSTGNVVWFTSAKVAWKFVVAQCRPLL